MIQDSAIFMFGIQGKTLSADEIAWLQHPLTAGVILFTRNYDCPEQITTFIQTIRQVADQEILISVDHEGGRVQRFKTGFTVLPAMAELGKCYDQDKGQACQLARDVGYVMATEILRCNIDFSFAPVLDVQNSISTIIGDRAFHSQIQQLSILANEFYQGVREAGSIGVGKHFPGHGNVMADSHLELPICEEGLDELLINDIAPFKSLIEAGIEAIMPAHILYTAVDGMPAGFSNFWLQQVLRQQLGFDGCIISDDLDMAGAAAFGDITQRVDLAARNCDLILLCNDVKHIQQAYAHQAITACPTRQARLSRLQRQTNPPPIARYNAAIESLQSAKLISL